LPGEFPEASTMSGKLYGARIIPPGMNDENKEDPGKHLDLKKCKYLVDSRFPSAVPSKSSPDHPSDQENWVKISCEPFLDAGATGIFGRLIWTPDSTLIPAKLRRTWGEYCLLKKR